MSGGPNPLALAPWRNDELITLGGWRANSGLTLTASSAPTMIPLGTNWYGLEWTVALTTTDYAACDFVMPFNFAESDGIPKFDIKLVCVARKIDAAADANTNLCLQAQMHWFTPGVLNDSLGRLATGTAPSLSTAAGSAQSLTTPAVALLATSLITSVKTAVAAFAVYELDIGKRIVAESKQLLAGDVCQLRVSPNEAVGCDGLQLIGAPVLRIRRVQNTPERLSVKRDV